MNILYLDIETTTQEGHFFGNTWDASILEVTRERSMLSIAWAWNEDRVQYADITDAIHYRRGDLDDFQLVSQVHALMEEADVWVAHHGDGFDLPRIRTRSLLHNLGPLPPGFSVDTKKELARVFGRYGQSNSLDAWSQRLGLGEKLDHTGYKLWLDCQEGDPKAWKLMKRYNKHDVVLLRDLYHAVSPYIRTMNAGFFDKGKTVCPNCGSTNLVIRKYYRTAVSEFVQTRCSDCGRYSKSRSRVPQIAKEGTDIPLR